MGEPNPLIRYLESHLREGLIKPTHQDYFTPDIVVRTHKVMDELEQHFQLKLFLAGAEQDTNGYGMANLPNCRGNYVPVQVVHASVEFQMKPYHEHPATLCFSQLGDVSFIKTSDNLNREDLAQTVRILEDNKFVYVPMEIMLHELPDDLKYCGDMETFFDVYFDKCI